MNQPESPVGDKRKLWVTMPVPGQVVAWYTSFIIPWKNLYFYIVILEFSHNMEHTHFLTWAGTNAFAESFNVKIKAFRGVRDIPFFIFRLCKLSAWIWHVHRGRIDPKGGGNGGQSENPVGDKHDLWVTMLTSNQVFVWCAWFIILWKDVCF